VLVAVLCGFAIARMGEAGKRAGEAVELATKVFFGIVRIIVRLAPIGAFGAMAFTVGAYDLASLSSLAKLVVAFYAAAIVFVLLILGVIARLSGFSLFRFLAYIKDELMIVVGTSSSETVIPDMIRKLRNLGSADSTVGLVFPMGYSFNNAGANIYMTLAVFFLAQANHVHFTFGQEMRILLVSFVASTGGAGVPGGAFVKVAAMLSVVPQIPLASLALLLGVDKLMSECRALANVIGNGVATLAVSRWEGEVDAPQLRRALRGEPNPEAGAQSSEPAATQVQEQPVIVARSTRSSG
jgi:aerobic C4-dicarboxylate transport protein